MITDLEGQKAVDCFCYINEVGLDRYSATNTIKVQGNVHIVWGSSMYSDSGSQFLEVVEDTIGRYHTVYECCGYPNTVLRYGV